MTFLKPFFFDSILSNYPKVNPTENISDGGEL